MPLPEVGRRSDFTIRPKPNSWPSSLNEYRIFGRTSTESVSSRKNLELEIQTKPIFNLYVQEVSRLTCMVVGTVRACIIIILVESGNWKVQNDDSFQVPTVHYKLQ